MPGRMRTTTEARGGRGLTGRGARRARQPRPAEESAPTAPAGRRRLYAGGMADDIAEVAARAGVTEAQAAAVLAAAAELRRPSQR